MHTFSLSTLTRHQPGCSVRLRRVDPVKEQYVPRGQILHSMGVLALSAPAF
jgi:hypothetical protein